MTNGSSHQFDLVLVGGGLANGLIALAVSERHPSCRIVILDANTVLGSGRTWSFHGSDVEAEAYDLLEPTIRASWPCQEIIFPELRRKLSTSYHSISRERFERRIRAAANIELRLGTRVEMVTGGGVVCENGVKIDAPCVIDGRGWQPAPNGQFALAYQKFVGLEIDTEKPHGLAHPVIMDARVEQRDGYRFVYLLPYTPTRLLVEDTYYSGDAVLDIAEISDRVYGYVAGRGWTVERVVGMESGVLPILLAGRVAPFHAKAGAAPPAGVRAGLFHPLTGYSLPYAARLALSIAKLPTITSDAVGGIVRRQADALWQHHSFYRLLNRLLFAAASGDERRHVMQHFYRLPQGLIERLYAGQSTTLDKIGMLTGRPPLPIARALAAVPEAAGWRFARQQRQADTER